MTQVMAIANQKGGVGKTCTTLNLGVGLANHGARVLLIDLDPQANLTMSLGWTNPDELETTIATLLDKTVREERIAQDEGILDCREGVKGEFDYVIIDCQPSLNILTVNALPAADSVLIPTQPQYFSTAGLQMLFQTIHRVQRKLNPELRIEGVLVTMMDRRPLFSRDLVEKLRENYGEYIKVFDTEIPTSIRVTESSAKGKSIYAYDPDGKAAQAYDKLTGEVLANERARDRVRRALHTAR